MRSVESSIEENVRFLDEVSERSISPHPKFDSYLTKHDKFNHNDRPSKLICEDCDKTCTHAAMLVSHKQTKHIINFKYLYSNSYYQKGLTTEIVSYRNK